MAEDSEAPATPEADEFGVDVPFSIVEGPEFLTVIDFGHQEICRIPTTTKFAKDLARLVCAAPWLATAAYRTLGDLNAAVERKDGTTLRQWAKHHEGYKRREELRHALEVTLNPDVATDPPESFHVKAPKSSVIPSKHRPRSFRDML